MEFEDRALETGLVSQYLSATAHTDTWIIRTLVDGRCLQLKPLCQHSRERDKNKIKTHNIVYRLSI